MLYTLSKPLVSLVEKYLPDAFIFVLLLTLGVMGSAWLFQDASLGHIVQYWGEGFWGLLQFSMQMLLILVNGFLLANTRIVQSQLNAVAQYIRTAGQAVVCVSIVALVSNWINWGFGLVISAFFAKTVARHVKVDYRLLVASAYSGFLVWHGGLSGSIPLTIASEGHFFQNQIAIIPTTETIFAPFNLVLLMVLAVSIPCINWLMMPKESDRVIMKEKLQQVYQEQRDDTKSSNYLENSRALSYLVSLAGMVYMLYYFGQGGALNLNMINFIFLFLAIFLHQTPYRLLATLKEAASSGAGIILQFPFYAGMMAVMVKTGLATSLSEQLIQFASTETFVFWSFLSAGLVNFFVPSGGGQWAVQAPILIPAAQEMGVDIARVAMAVSWGDAWTNMIQPFWALPILAIAGLNAKDIMGFCLVHLLFSGAMISLCLTYL